MKLESPLLNIKEAAQYLRTSERKIAELRSLEEIPYLKIGSHLWFSKEELDKWIKRKTSKVG